MGSNYFGVEKSSSSSSSLSSRRSKKSSSSDKPKQPQRGLGVAQLEQIRLRTQMASELNPSLIHGGFPDSTGLPQEDMRLLQGVPYAMPQSSTSYAYSQSSTCTPSPYHGHNPSIMMVFGGERANLRYQDNSQPSTTSRWNPNSTGVLDSSPYAQAAVPSRHSFTNLEDSRQKRIDLIKSMGSSSQNSESSDHEDVDLELRLSI